MQLGLGTVQFGLAYGVAGRGVSVPEDEVRAILQCAAASGVRVLDTAPLYGDIESRLARLTQGLRFDIVSKIPPIPAGAAASVRDAVARAVDQSRARLGAALHTLLFHRPED